MGETSAMVIIAYRLFERLFLLVALFQSVQCYWYNPLPSPDSHTSVNQSAYSSSHTFVNQSINTSKDTVNQSANTSKDNMNQFTNTSKDNHPENHFNVHFAEYVRKQVDNSTKPQNDKENYKTAVDTSNTTRTYHDIIHNNSSASVSSHSNDFKFKDLIKNICGVDNFCTKNIRISSGFHTEPTCCPVCNCDTSCVTARSCCPGQKLHMSEFKPEDPVCMPLYNILTKAADHQTQIQPFQEKTTSTNQNTYTETNLNHKPIHVSSNGSPSNPIYAEYLVISSCPPDYHDPELSANCSKPQSEYITDYIPLFDTVTRKLYFNHFCAICHNATSFLTMKIVTNCTELYLMEPLPVYLEDLNRIMDTGNCLAYVDPYFSKLIQTNLCYTDRKDSSIISKCNITGQWELYDAYTESMCLEGSHIVPYKSNDGNETITYNNIYCYMCNSRTNYEEKCSASEYHNYEHLPDDPFAGFNALISMPVYAGHVQYILTPQDNVFSYKNGRHCMKGFFPDVYTNQCRRFVCPLNETPFYNLCLTSTKQVTGLTVTGKLHIAIRESYINIHHINQTIEIVAAIQERITNYLEVEKLGCKSVPGEIYTSTESEYINSFQMVYKIQNTHSCSIQTVIEIFTKIKETNSALRLQQTSSNAVLIFSMKMIYKKLSSGNFTMMIKPKVEEPVKQHEVMLNASFDCPRVVVNLSDYYSFVEQGILKHVNKNILHQEYTTDTQLLEICIAEYLEHWLILNNTASQVYSIAINTFDVSFTATVTIGSMLCIIFVIVTYCLFPELRFMPGKLVMVLSSNLLLAQSFYAFGINLEVDNLWCKIFGISVHFFWLSILFSMNAILILMVRSLYKPLHVANRVIIDSRSTSEFIKYVIHCYLMPAVFVLINILSSALHITDQFGYGGELCYIREAKMRLYTFVIPLGIVMVINFILFILIIFLLRFYMKTSNENVLVKQIFIIMKLITMSGIYWIFGFVYAFTHLAPFKYMFILLIAGQGIFLMWSFICNWHVYDLYKTAISKYIRKLWEDKSQSYSMSSPCTPHREIF